MSKTVVSIVALIGVSIAAIWIAKSRQDQIRVYTIPREVTAPAQTTPVTSHATASMSAHPTYTLPPNWTEQPGSHMGETSFQVTLADHQTLEASFIPFPNMAGQEPMVVNIAREQIGLERATAAQIDASGVATQVGNQPGTLYDLQSPPSNQGAQAQRMIVVIVHQGSFSWFFKLAGQANLVEEAKPSFLSFLGSVSFPATPSPTAPLAMAPAAPAGASDLPSWNVPAGWTPAAPGPMIAAAFTGPNDTKVTVTSLGGMAGGLLANVNRWRGQLNLPPIDQTQLKSNAQPLILGTHTGSLVDIIQTSGQPHQRIVAIVVALADKTWFYKLTGTQAAVDPVKDELITFVRSVRYHEE